jgi:hypothetical protein
VQFEIAIECDSVQWSGMDWEENDEDEGKPQKSLGGIILRAVSTGALLVCLGYVGKSVFAGAAADLVTGIAAGALSLICSVGAAAVERACTYKDEDVEAIGKRSVLVSAPAMAIAEAEVAERCEGRFTAMLEQRREQGVGKEI